MRSERGGVTVELALALPAVVALAAMILVLGTAAISQISCANAARAGARAAALGLANDSIKATATELAGSDVTVRIERRDGQVKVRVDKPVGTLASTLFGLRLKASATAVSSCEPDRGCR
ncbi:MAG: pilus assembly protein [Micrococcales bacterium]|nr:pilus assembly protein [Micrococcales bacterium]